MTCKKDGRKIGEGGGRGGGGGRKCTYLLASFSSQNETVTSVCLSFRPLHLYIYVYVSDEQKSDDPIIFASIGGSIGATVVIVMAFAMHCYFR